MQGFRSDLLNAQSRHGGIGLPRFLRSHRGANKFIGMLAGLDNEAQGAAVAPDFEFHRLADFFSKDFALEVGGEGDLLAVNLGNDIARREVALLNRSTGLDASNDNSGFQTLQKARPLREVFEARDRNSQPGAAHISASEKLLRDSPRQVDRNGKTNAPVVATDERVNADHPTVDVTKRATAISGVDRGVGLDELVVISAETEIATFCTHHAESEGVG